MKIRKYSRKKNKSKIKYSRKKNKRVNSRKNRRIYKRDIKTKKNKNKRYKNQKGGSLGAESLNYLGSHLDNSLDLDAVDLSIEPDFGSAPPSPPAPAPAPSPMPAPAPSPMPAPAPSPMPDLSSRSGFDSQLSKNLAKEFVTYSENDIVYINGLKSETGMELNGLRARIKNPQPNRKGYVQCMVNEPGGLTIRGIKPENLERVHATENTFKQWLFEKPKIKTPIPLHVRNSPKKFITCHSVVYPGSFEIKRGVRIITFSSLGECFTDSGHTPFGRSGYDGYLSSELIDRIFIQAGSLFADDDQTNSRLSDDALRVFDPEYAPTWGKGNWHRLNKLGMKLHGVNPGSNKMNNMLIKLDCREDGGRSRTDHRDFCKIEYLDTDSGGRKKSIYDKSEYIDILDQPDSVGDSIDLERLIEILGEGLYIIIGCRVLRRFDGIGSEDEAILTKENSGGSAPRLNIRGEKIDDSPEEVSNCIIS